MRSIAALVLFIGLACALNHYTQCSTCATSYNTWYWDPYYCANLNSLTVPESNYYSIAYNSTTTIYYNFCGPLSICNGGVACTVTNGQDPVIFAYPNSDTNIYVYYNEFQANYYHYTGIDYYSFYINVECSSSSYSVSSYSLYDTDLDIYAYSSAACQQSSIAPNNYIYPKNFTNLSGNVYLAGQIPMFVMDKASTPKSTFEGNFYYSQTYNSMRINGTLSANDGSGTTSEVAFLFDGSNNNNNPAIMVSYVNLPNSNSKQCILLPNTFDDDDSDLQWFAPQKNRYFYGYDTYSSIYFNKGTTFNVTTYGYNLNYAPYTTLMQRTSDGLPVFVGGSNFAPMVNSYDNPNYISEFDWSTMSTQSLSSSLFSIPSSWGCQE